MMDLIGRDVVYSGEIVTLTECDGVFAWIDLHNGDAIPTRVKQEDIETIVFDDFRRLGH
jgi:hypothetical protein